MACLKQKSYKMYLLLSVIGAYLVYTSAENEIPAVIWGFGSSSENLPSVSALETISTKTFANEIINKSVKPNNLLVIFLEEKLSTEDFSVYDTKGKQAAFSNIKSYVKTGPSVFLSRVENPVKAVDKLSEQYRMKKIKISSDVSVEKQLPKSVKDIDVLVIHLPSLYTENRYDTLKNSDDIIGKVLDALSSQKKPVVAAYFGVKSSWDPSERSNFSSRKMLATPEESSNLFFNLTGCLYFYARNASISIKQPNENKTEHTFQSATILPGSSCENTSLARLGLQFDNGNLKLKLWMNFTKSYRGWALSNSTAEREGSNLVVMKNNAVEAPSNFSYSCYSTTFGNKNSSDDLQIRVTFERFQVQPFIAGSEKFAPSFDCTPFMTIPIFMGLIVMCLFTAVLAFGIYAVMDIKTMDRFDDPRGKCITIPVTE